MSIYCQCVLSVTVQNHIVKTLAPKICLTEKTLVDRVFIQMVKQKWGQMKLWHQLPNLVVIKVFYYAVVDHMILTAL